MNQYKAHPIVVWPLSGISGADTITGGSRTTFPSYEPGMLISWVAASNNTGAATININSAGAKSLTKNGATALAAGDLVSGREYIAVYDGTQFQVLTLAAGAGSGAITASGYTMSTNRLLGRTTAGTGAVEEITVVANNGLLLSAGSLSVDRAAQTDMETPTSGNKIVASTAVLFHPGVVKAFCRFDPTGSLSGPSYNVSSITDNGVGDWSVNISGSFPLSTANGTVVLSVDHSAPLVAVVNARTSASVYRIRCYDFLSILTDPAFINFAILGDCT